MNVDTENDRKMELCSTTTYTIQLFIFFVVLLLPTLLLGLRTIRIQGWETGDLDHAIGVVLSLTMVVLTPTTVLLVFVRIFWGQGPAEEGFCIPMTALWVVNTFLEAAFGWRIFNHIVLRFRQIFLNPRNNGKVSIEKVQELEWDVEVFSLQWNIFAGITKSYFFNLGKRCKLEWKLEAEVTNIHTVVTLRLLSIRSTDWSTPGLVGTIAYASIGISENVPLCVVEPNLAVTADLEFPVKVCKGRMKGIRYVYSQLKELLTHKDRWTADRKQTVFCEIRVKYPSTPAKKKIQSLREDMTRLWNMRSGNFGDVVIQAKGKHFSVHKAILSARSPVFAAMFRSNMLEDRENMVGIKDADVDAVEGMLEFIYTGHTFQLNSRSGGYGKKLEILALADRYQLPGLTEQCECALQFSLTVENARDILFMADCHNAWNLKSAAAQFIQENQDSLVDNEEFQETFSSHSALQGQVLALHRLNSNVADNLIRRIEN